MTHLPGSVKNLIDRLIRLTRGLITLVSENRVDNYLKEIWRLYTIYGSIVNNRSKNNTVGGTMKQKQ